MIQQVGSVVNAGGKLKVMFPERMRSELQTAVETLKSHRVDAIDELARLQSQERAQASVVLKNAGMRLMELEGGTTVGLWSDLDGPDVRAALRIFESYLLPVRYLDGSRVPMRYKVRRVHGEPVPMNVLSEMERLQEKLAQYQRALPLSEQPAPAEFPWTARDRMLSAMGCSPGKISWADWKVATVNRLFLEQGALGQSGRITTETVRDGERRNGTTAYEDPSERRD
jgi:hypothetical protein